MNLALPSCDVQCRHGVAVEQGFGMRRASCRIKNTPEWRNGRRGGLKIRWSQGRVGSTPSSGTILSPTSNTLLKRGRLAVAR